ncbi:MAG: hypothetical protein GWP91_01345 [Rhodobacterales bacterium]|nr:hypothetical protein [Rhodobacterales bacterium]
MTHKLATIADLPQAIDEIRKAKRVAVDTEFHAERRYLPLLYLVQVQIPGGNTWLFDALEPDLIRGIAEALRETPWVVHAGSQDLVLLNLALGALPDVIYDTQLAAGLLDSDYPAAFVRLMPRWLGVSICKDATLSDWSRRPLTDKQIRYAAEDVEQLVELWDVLDEKLRETGRRELAQLAFEEARSKAIAQEGDTSSWRRMGAVGVLDGPGLSTMQALAEWREDVGRTLDQPPRMVLSDGLMFGLARNRPRTIQSLYNNRRFPRSLIKKHGQAIVDTIQRGAERPEWAWPKVAGRRTPNSRVLAVAVAACDWLAEDLGFGRQLLVPDETLSDLVIQRPSSLADVEERLGWRAPLVALSVWNILGGRIQLKVDGCDISAVSDTP